MASTSFTVTAPMVDDHHLFISTVLLSSSVAFVKKQWRLVLAEARGLQVYGEDGNELLVKSE